MSWLDVYQLILYYFQAIMVVLLWFAVLAVVVRLAYVPGSFGGQ